MTEAKTKTDTWFKIEYDKQSATYQIMFHSGDMGAESEHRYTEVELWEATVTLLYRWVKEHKK